MRNLKRREFLGVAAGAVGVSLLYPAASWWQLRQSVQSLKRGKEEALESSRGTLVLTSKSFLQLVNISEHRAARIELPNKLAHDVCFSPADPEQCVAIDLYGPTSALVDVRSKQVIRSLTADEGMAFSGHGVFSSDGSWLYLPEFPVSLLAEGYVSVISTQSWKKEAKFSSGAAQTHEVLPLEGGAVLAVGHYGRAVKGMPLRDGVLSFLDAKSGRIISSVSAPDPFHSFCHLDKTVDDRLVVATRSWKAHGQRPNGSFIETHFPTPMAFGGRGREWFFSNPEPVSDRLRLSLSVRVDESRGRVLTTHMIGNFLSAWDLGGRFLGGAEIPDGPMGLSYTTDKKFCLLNSIGGELRILDPVTLREVTSISLRGLGLDPAAHSEFKPEQLVGA